MRHTYKLFVIMLLKSIKDQFNEVVKESGVNYEVVKSISGYYRLVVHNDDMTDTIAHDDSACEDVYDEESAMALFTDLIIERHNL